MNKLYFYIVIISSIFVFLSCNFTNSDKRTYPILKVSLVESETSFFSLFNKADLIPLETSSESFIRYIEKIEVSDSLIYVFDRSQFAIFTYTNKGAYKNKLSKVGQGPGEYTRLTDFVLNKPNQRLVLLSPFGTIYSYSLDGLYVESYTLPNSIPNYQKLEKINDGNYIIWSDVLCDEKQINIISKEGMNISNSFFSSNRVATAFSLAPGVFNTYNDNVYFHNAFSNKIYHVTADTLTIDYEWDFGANKLSLLDEVFEDFDQEATRKVEDRLKNSEIPFYYLKQFQNNKYYYTQLIFDYKWENRKSIFYDRKTSSGLFFKKTTEGISFEPIYFDDEYMICIINISDKEALLNSKILSEKDNNRLKLNKEDDNPWLVKYTFK